MEYNHTMEQNESFSDTELWRIDKAFMTYHTKPSGYIIFTVFLSFSLIGIVLNIGTIYIIQYGRNIGREIKLQLTNLAVADLLFALLVPVLAAFQVLNFPFMDSAILCHIERFVVLTITSACPSWNLVISLERFVIIFFPFKAAHYTRKYKIIVAITAWVVGCLLHIDSFIFAKLVRDPQTNVMSCLVVVTSSTSLNRLLSAVKYILPSSTMTIVSIAISYKVECRQQIGETPTPYGKKVKKVSRPITIYVSALSFSA